MEESVFITGIFGIPFHILLPFAIILFIAFWRADSKVSNGWKSKRIAR